MFEVCSLKILRHVCLGPTLDPFLVGRSWDTVMLLLLLLLQSSLPQGDEVEGQFPPTLGDTLGYVLLLKRGLRLYTAAHPPLSAWCVTPLLDS